MRGSIHTKNQKISYMHPSDITSPCSVNSANQVRYITASAEDAGQRLDNFLMRQLKGVPKSHLYRLIRKGEVRINSKRTKPLYKLVAGDHIRIPPVRTARQEQKKISTAQQLGWLAAYVCFEDKDILVCNKPAGLAVHGGSGVDLGFIEYMRIWQNNQRLELVHRIDRYTTGCLLLVKRRSLLQPLQAIWHSNQVEKTYLALVAGQWPKTMKNVHMSLSSIQRHGEKYIRPDAQGQYAETLFHLQHYVPHAPQIAAMQATMQTVPHWRGDFSLVEAKLVTGRTHQIRVHCQYAGYPLIGDTKYGDPAINQVLVRSGYKSMFLHAASLTFVHPVTQKIMTISARIHPAEQQLLQMLGIKKQALAP